MNANILLVVALLTVTSSASAVNCYRIIDNRDNLVYQSSISPIDLSRTISEEMSAKHPGKYFQMFDSPSCPELEAAVALPINPRALESLKSLEKGLSGTDARIDSYNDAYSNSSIPNWKAPTSSSRATGVSNAAGNDISVRGYTRSDGSYVPAHTRSAPGRRR